MSNDENDDDFDFLGNSSMKELALRMDEIDKEIEAIAEVDKKTPEKKIDSTFYETPEAAAAIEKKLSEDRDNKTIGINDDEEEDESLAITQLQNEIKALERKDSPKLNDTVITATARKATPTAPIGIAMKTKERITRIVGISPDGPLAHTSLEPGLQLTMVNGIEIKNARHAQYLIQQSPESVTFVAKAMKS